MLIVGGKGGTHVGGSFHRAAGQLGVSSEIVDSGDAFEGSRIRRFVAWRLQGRRPVRLHAFGRKVLDVNRSFEPQLLLTTGLAPLTADALKQLSAAGTTCVNFLTDDPWNPAHHAPWFIKALPAYDIIFSPRRAMMPDLARIGCKNVRYLPFGYDAQIFSPPGPDAPTQAECADVVFAGGADEDRVPHMLALVRAGFTLSLYGNYWHRYRSLRSASRGMADAANLSQVLSSAKVALCLVRKANRDGSCMRTFEVPAVGTCMLVEDTEEHRQIFGDEGVAVLYFDSIEEMVVKCRQLCDDDVLRLRLANAAHQLITNGGNTYADRLRSILAQRGWDDER
ncbi:glycosyltransferase [Ramlibacter sp. WS9]|uniref:CgeB family protein n=1 Tax=Ramlibacter sp. WS9 TaxID=1882741 RepID=UPI0018EE6934|nr:glycosyltransferase [Ramlibacter sp. WS9]